MIRALCYECVESKEYEAGIPLEKIKEDFPKSDCKHKLLFRKVGKL